MLAFIWVFPLCITWQHVDVLVSVHVERQVTGQFPEQPDLGPQLELHLGRKMTQRHKEVTELQRDRTASSQSNIY